MNSANDNAVSSHIDVKTACAQIAASLKSRSGKRWSVTHDRGTAYGWITIISLPSARKDSEFGYMSDADCAELAALLGESSVHMQGHSVSPESRRFVVDRAAGRP